MNSLFISTYDSLITIGLLYDGKIIEKLEECSTRNHSMLIMPMIKKILQNNNLNVHNLNEIIIVNGPGSFTGVRLGVTIAKTLSYTLNIPIKTITSLECIALTSDEKNKIAIVSDLKGKYVGIFKNETKEFNYLTNRQYEELNKDNYVIIDNNKFDLEKIYRYLKKQTPTICHNVNPIYIKNIEALSDK